MKQLFLAFLVLASTAVAVDDADCAGKVGTGRQRSLFNPDLPNQLAQIEVVGANLKFAINMLDQLAGETKDQTILISPTSLSTALTMVRAAAKGKMAMEMDAVLHYQTDLGEILRGNQIVNAALNASNPGSKIATSNRLWVSPKITLKRSYATQMKDVFAALSQTLDFGKPTAATVINEDVATATDGMIPEIIERTSSSDLLYLTSAIALDAQWEIPFDPKLTRTDSFLLPDGSKKNVNMMSRLSRAAYWANTMSKHVGLRLPLAGNHLVVDLILPSPGTTPEEWLSKLGDDALNGLQAEASAAESKPTEIYVNLPRLSLGFGGEMIPSLEALGIKRLFSKTEESQDELDFFEENEVVRVSKVIHKAKLELDEVGVRAGAATAVAVTRSLKPSIAFNRPFVIIIRDTKTKTVPFIGIVNDPGAL